MCVLCGWVWFKSTILLTISTVHFLSCCECLLLWSVTHTFCQEYLSRPNQYNAGVINCIGTITTVACRSFHMGLWIHKVRVSQLVWSSQTVILWCFQKSFSPENILEMAGIYWVDSYEVICLLSARIETVNQKCIRWAIITISSRLLASLPNIQQPTVVKWSSAYSRLPYIPVLGIFKNFGLMNMQV